MSVVTLSYPEIHVSSFSFQFNIFWTGGICGCQASRHELVFYFQMSFTTTQFTSLDQFANKSLSHYECLHDDVSPETAMPPKAANYV